MRLSFLIALVALTLVGCGDSNDRAQSTDPAHRTVEEQAPPAGAAGQPELSVVERPRTERDQLPRFAKKTAEGNLGAYEVDPERSRHLGKREGVNLYAVPGERDICIFTGNGAGSCATQEQAATGNLLTVQIDNGWIRAWGSVPDGPTEVTASFEEGPDEVVPVENNVWVIRTQRTLRSVAWDSEQSSGSVKIPGF